MSDTITAKANDAKFLPHPTGQFVGQCVDMIDLGEKVESFPGTPDKLSHKCAVVFRTGELNEQTGEFTDMAQEFTVSMGEKANLRKFLEQWRGKPYTADQISEGVPLHKLTGNHGLLTVAHKTSQKGRTYAVLAACVGVPKQMASGVERYDDYKRAEYWTERKQEYAAEAAKFRAKNAPPPDDDDDMDHGAPFDDDSSLPF